MRVVLTSSLAMMMIFGAVSFTSAGQIQIDNATVYFIEDARVPAQEEGVLRELFVGDGQPVAKDAVLAQVDDTLVKLQHNVANAELAVARRKSEDKISVIYAKRAADVYKKDYERMRDSNARLPGTVPQADIELARLKWDQYDLQAEKSEFDRVNAEYEMKVSEAKMAAAEEHIKRSQILAPWDGVVDRVVRFTGDWVKPGDPILRMIRMDKLRVTGEIDARQYRREDVIGRPVTVQVELTKGVYQTFTGRITDGSHMIEANNAFHVWTEIDNPRRGNDYLLQPGMWAKMTIETVVGSR
ncbi:MAG TPA: HlyD family efflux transporter periplasmic adaptor subunit [Thermoguttaceae bacterium]|nr:HlyD family efflux transporter periplasmic adaptor subunit [Thermoguttaceae bacterium]